MPRRGGAWASKRAAQIKAAVSVLWQQSLILELVHSVRGPSAWEIGCCSNARMKSMVRAKRLGVSVQFAGSRESGKMYSSQFRVSVGCETQYAHA